MLRNRDNSIQFNLNYYNDDRKKENINLLNSSFNPCDCLPKDLTITTKYSSFSFNKDMMANTSSVIEKLIQSNNDEIKFETNIDDKYNTMQKLEQLYQLKTVAFSENDLPILKQIISVLNLKDFPSIFDNPISKNEKSDDLIRFKISCYQNSIFSYFQSLPNNFIINTKKGEYLCNEVGAKSAKIFSEMLPKQYTYDFDDENNTFQYICDYFNFRSIVITPRNVQSLKKIAQDLKINCLSEKIDEFYNNYIYTTQIISKQNSEINTITELFQYLYNRKNLKIETIKEILLNSSWVQNKENLQEFVACIIQVIHTDVLLHPFIMDLVTLLSTYDDFKNLINILATKLLNNLGFNKLNCAFIYRLIQKGIISKEDFVFKINRCFRLNNCDLKITYNFNRQRINNTLTWFFPELIDIGHIPIDLIYVSIDSVHEKFVKKYYPDHIDQFIQMRDSGEPDDELTKMLRKDDVEGLKELLSKNDVVLDSDVPFNIFEYYIQNGQTTPLNYAAAYGSFKCFQCLLLNGKKKGFNTLPYAIFGQNKDIIDLIEKPEPVLLVVPNTPKSINPWSWNKPAFPGFMSWKPIPFPVENKKKPFKQNEICLGISPEVMSWLNKNNPSHWGKENPVQHYYKYMDDIYFYNFGEKNENHLLAPAIIKHNNELLDWVLENKYTKSSKEIEHLFKLAFMNGNIYSLLKLIDNGLDFSLLIGYEIKEFFEISSRFGFRQLCILLFNLVFKDATNKYGSPNKIIDFSDSFSFGSLPIIKLYESFITNYQGIDFNTPLLISIINEDFDIIKYCFESGFRDKFQLYPKQALSLIKASFFNQKTDIYNYLINQLVEKENLIPNFPCFKDDSLLDEACSTGNLEYVKIIYNLISKENPKMSYTSSILVAAEYRFKKIFNFLIDQKVPINFNDIMTRRGYHFNEHSMVLNVPKEYFSVLYDIANEDEKEEILCNTALLEYVMKNGNCGLVDFLLEKGASHEYALVMSVDNHDIEMVKVVLKNDKSNLFINKITAKGTALNVAVENNDIEIVRLLLSLPEIDPSLYLANYQTPLVTAFQKSYYDIIDLIIDFYDDDIQSQKWQIDQVIKRILTNEIKLTEDIIRYLLKIPNVNLNYHLNSSTLLTYACERNYKEIVSILLNDFNCDANFCLPESGRTALMISIEKEKDEIAELLIQSPRTNVNQKDHLENSALTIAVDKDSSYIVNLIINSKSFDPKLSFLDYAFMISKGEVSIQLSKIKDLNVNYYYDDGFLHHNKFMKEDQISFTGTSLIYAVNEKDEQKIDLIVQHPSFNRTKSQIKKAIFKAVKDHNFSIFKKLLPFINDDVNIHTHSLFDPRSLSLLSVASQNENTDIINEILIQPSFDSVKSNIDVAYCALLTSDSLFINYTLLDKFQKIDSTHLIDFKKPLSNGKSFFTSIVYRKANNAFYFNSFKNDINITEFYLNKGVDPDSPDAFGIYPLQHAIKFLSLESVNVLIDSGKIDFKRKIKEYEGQTTYLHLAAKNKNNAIIEKILSQNVININEPNCQGDTPLLVATKENLKENVKSLFQYQDLDFGYRNFEGKDAIDIACNSCAFGALTDHPESKESYFNALLTIMDKKEKKPWEL